MTPDEPVERLRLRVELAKVENDKLRIVNEDRQHTRRWTREMLLLLISLLGMGGGVGVAWRGIKTANEPTATTESP